MEEKMIKLINISKKFNKEKALNDINIEFEKGKIHGIIGGNGCGKTTLIKLICGFIFQDNGEVIVNNRKVGIEFDFPDKVGVLTESSGFILLKNGYKNLEYLASMKNEITKNDIEKAMILVGLNPKDKKKVLNYSVGFKQRLGLAQAIMENPELLVLDEPMNGLDSDGVEKIKKLLLRLKNEGKTILLASRNKEYVESLCDTITIMDKGSIVNR